MAGDTTSLNFPTTSGAFQHSNRGSQNVFVAKLNPSGSALVYGTYLGGSLTDHAAGIAVDASGAAFLAGSTWSLNFPVANAYQSALAGGQDAFVTRLAASGASLLFSTYLGGTGGTVGQPETANGITLDAQGAAYVTGTTSSSNFPLLNPYQSTLRGWTDGFVSKFSSAGGLVYSTYLGGSGLDTANGITVDASGNAYIAGYTSVMDMVTVTASASPGAYNAFMAELSPSGNALAAYAYIVDNGSDTSNAIALDRSGNIYFAGWTLSSNFPVISGIQAGNGGGYCAFVAKVSFAAPKPATMTSPASGSTLSGASVTFQWSSGSGVSDYWLYVSNVAAGGDELWNTDEGSKTSQAVTGLPGNGSTVYVRLWSEIGTVWEYIDYTYKAAAPTLATMVSPVNGSTLSGSSVTFQWSAGNGVSEYWLYASKVSVGGTDLWNNDEGTEYVADRYRSSGGRQHGLRAALVEGRQYLELQ